MGKLLLPTELTLIAFNDETRSSTVQAAMWRTCSPHEWEWTKEQQADMALYVLWAEQRLQILERIAKGEPFNRTI
jgi:hypothetical protein